MDYVARCADLLYTEARLIDQKAWDDWLALYLPEAEFWIPAWESENSYTTDPHNEISLIFTRVNCARAKPFVRILATRTPSSPASPH